MTAPCGVFVSLDSRALNGATEGILNPLPVTQKCARIVHADVEAMVHVYDVVHAAGDILPRYINYLPPSNLIPSPLRNFLLSHLMKVVMDPEDERMTYQSPSYRGLRGVCFPYLEAYDRW